MNSIRYNSNHVNTNINLNINTNNCAQLSSKTQILTQEFSTPLKKATDKSKLFLSSQIPRTNSNNNNFESNEITIDNYASVKDEEVKTNTLNHNRQSEVHPQLMSPKKISFTSPTTNTFTTHFKTPSRSYHGNYVLSPSYRQASMASTASQSYVSPQTPTNSNRLETNEVIIATRFKLLRKLGKGSFGVAYESIDLSSKLKVALKLEKKRDELGNREIELLQKLNDCNRVPKLLWHGSYKQYHAMALQLEGPNICTLLENCGDKFSLKTSLHCMMEFISCLEQIHNCGIVHRDIKPQNFIVGINDPSKIFIIDFGLSTSFINFMGDHIPYEDNCPSVGTARYASLNNHRGIHQTRRDDLESIVYVILFCLKGELPWQGLCESDRAKKWKKIEHYKASINAAELTHRLPHEFCYFLDYVKKLKYDEKPDYDKLRKVFRNLYDVCGYKNDKNFDWTQSKYNCIVHDRQK